MTPPLTREAFERQRVAIKTIETREGRVAAIVSVGLGGAQLVLLNFADAQFAHPTAVAIEGVVFLMYLGLVGWLIWRMQQRVRAARLRCPQCGTPLANMSERVAAATGRCDACGGQVIADAPAPFR